MNARVTTAATKVSELMATREAVGPVGGRCEVGQDEEALGRQGQIAQATVGRPEDPLLSLEGRSTLRRPSGVACRFLKSLADKQAHKLVYQVETADS